MDVSRRESEQLRGASHSGFAELGGLPDAETIQQEQEAEAIRNFAHVFGIDESDVRAFVEEQ